MIENNKDYRIEMEIRGMAMFRVMTEIMVMKRNDPEREFFLDGDRMCIASMLKEAA